MSTWGFAWFHHYSQTPMPIRHRRQAQETKVWLFACVHRTNFFKKVEVFLMTPGHEFCLTRRRNGAAWPAASRTSRPVFEWRSA